MVQIMNMVKSIWIYWHSGLSSIKFGSLPLVRKENFFKKNVIILLSILSLHSRPSLCVFAQIKFKPKYTNFS